MTKKIDEPRKKQIAIGDSWVDVVDKSQGPHFSDYIVEARWHGSTVYLGFGSFAVDAETSREMQVTNRIRMPFDTAKVLHDMLGQMLADAFPDIDQSKVN